MNKLFFEGLSFIVEKNSVSIAGLQRQFKIGFTRAVKLIEEYEKQGFIENTQHGYVIKVSLKDVEKLKQSEI